MMTRVATALLLVVCALGVGGWQQQKHVHKFSELPKGNVLKIDLLSSGCFGGDADYFTFENNRERRISIVGLPTLTLDDDDVNGLDKLLDFYRHVKKGYCTSVDTVTIKEYRGDKVLATETYVDRTCSTWDAKDMLSLYAITERAQEAKTQIP